MARQGQLLVEYLAHLQAQSISQVGADQVIEDAGIGRPVQQIKLGGKFPVQQSATRWSVQQEIEFAHRVVAVELHLQAMGLQQTLLFKIKGQQLFSIQAQAGIEFGTE